MKGQGIYYNRDLTEETFVYDSQWYTRIGDNNMMGDMGDMPDKHFSSSDAKDFALLNNYRIDPVEQFIYESTSTSKVSTGPRNSVTITNGTITTINEKYSIIPSDQNMITKHTHTWDHKTGQTIPEMIMGTYHTEHAYTNFYTPSSNSGSGIFQNIMKSGAAIMMGEHDYTNSKNYPTWSSYSNATGGKGHLLKHRRFPSN